MRRLCVIGAVLGMFSGAFAADVTIYHLPSCPHCHHAIDFARNNLVYEYPTVKVTTVSLGEPENRPLFPDVMKKCELKSGGVPVLVIGEKCFQGYGDSMRDDLRAAIEVDLDKSVRDAAHKNRTAMESDGDAFRASHTAATITEFVAGPKAQKKSDNSDRIVFYIIIGVLLVGVGIILARKTSKK